MPTLTRRTLLTGSALAALGAGGGADPVAATAPPAGTQAPGVYRYTIGEFELTALYDGIWYRPIGDKFIRNAPFAEVESALAQAFMPTDKLTTPFTTLIVNTGKKLVLLDTGTGGQIAPSAGMIVENLAAAGLSPKAVDLIVISHFHPDHINGIKDKDNALIFPNAEILVPAAEWAFWMDDANMNAAAADLKLTFRNQRRIFADIAGQVTRFEPGKEVTPGISTLPAPGHTPGTVVVTLASARESALFCGDVLHHAIQVYHPRWNSFVCADAELARASRRRVLEQCSGTGALLLPTHFGAPFSCRIEAKGGGFLPRF